MKVRNGFVSNSSSSSFVVILPENFIDTVDFEEISQGDEEFPVEMFKQMLNRFISDGYLYDEEFYYSYRSDYELKEIFEELMKPYVIASIDTSSDAGCTVIGDRERVQKILDETK